MARTARLVLASPQGSLSWMQEVLIALTGIELHGRSLPRSAAGVSWPEAARRLAPMTLVIGILATGAAVVEMRALPWLVQVLLPMLLVLDLPGKGNRAHSSGAAPSSATSSETVTSHSATVCPSQLPNAPNAPSRRTAQRVNFRSRRRSAGAGRPPAHSLWISP